MGWGCSKSDEYSIGVKANSKCYNFVFYENFPISIFCRSKRAVKWKVQLLDRKTVRTVAACGPDSDGRISLAVSVDCSAAWKPSKGQKLDFLGIQLVEILKVQDVSTSFPVLFILKLSV